MQETKYEILLRLSIFAGLLVVITLAAYATYRLHKIADFQVNKIYPSKEISFTPGVFSRSFSTLPKL